MSFSPEVGPVVDVFMRKLGAFVSEHACLNSGAIAQKPLPERGHELLSITTVVDAKTKSKQYQVKAAKMSKNINLNFCGEVSRYPKADGGRSHRQTEKLGGHSPWNFL
jgi:hypothetical protein